MRWRRVTVLVLSLALACFIGIAWYRSYNGPDVLHWTTHGQRFIGVTSGHGTVDLLYIAHWPQEPEFRLTRYDSVVYYGTRYSKRLLGFGAATLQNGGRYVNIPHWFLLVMAITPAAWAGWRMRRSRESGRCRKCGYDLRATPMRCPECGTEVADAAGEREG